MFIIETLSKRDELATIFLKRYGMMSRGRIDEVVINVVKGRGRL